MGPNHSGRLPPPERLEFGREPASCDLKLTTLSPLLASSALLRRQGRRRVPDRLLDSVHSLCVFSPPSRPSSPVALADLPLPLLFLVGRLPAFNRIRDIFERVVETKRMQGERRPPIVIVGNKADRGDTDREVSLAMGQNLAAELGADAFFEVSTRLSYSLCWWAWARQAELSLGGEEDGRPELTS